MSVSNVKKTLQSSGSNWQQKTFSQASQLWRMKGWIRSLWKDSQKWTWETKWRTGSRLIKISVNIKTFLTPSQSELSKQPKSFLSLTQSDIKKNNLQKHQNNPAERILDEAAEAAQHIWWRSSTCVILPILGLLPRGWIQFLRRFRWMNVT